MKSGIAVVVGCLVGAASSYIFLRSELAQLNEELRLRPPVLVVNQLKLAADFKDSPTAQEVRTFLTQTNKAIEKFEDAGYLVLSSEEVVSAPADLMLTVDDVNSTITD